MIDRWIGVQSTQDYLPKNHFSGFQLIECNRKCNSTWRNVWMTCIWTKKNNIVFRNLKFDVREVFTLSQVKT